MELEMKFKVDKDYAPILCAKGYQEGGFHHQTDTYFLNGETIKGAHTWLRLRQDHLEKTYSIGFHRMKVDFMADETEVPLPDLQQVSNVQMIFETIGFPVQCVVNKKRRTFRKDDFEVVLDEIEGLGSFLEVELIADGTDENMHRLHAAIHDLGLDIQNAINTGYPNLLIAAQQKQG